MSGGTKTLKTSYPGWCRSYSRNEGARTKWS
jgi:hypothetical protein